MVFVVVGASPLISLEGLFSAALPPHVLKPQPHEAPRD